MQREVVQKNFHKHLIFIALLASKSKSHSTYYNGLSSIRDATNSPTSRTSGFHGTIKVAYKKVLGSLFFYSLSICPLLLVKNFLCSFFSLQPSLYWWLTILYTIIALSFKKQDSLSKSHILHSFWFKILKENLMSLEFLSTIGLFITSTMTRERSFKRPMDR